MSRITLIEVPYHLGQERVGIGAGPPHLRDALSGFDAVAVERGGDFSNEVAASFMVIRAVADAVRAVVARGEFPVVLAGNCSSALGTVAGLAGEPGVVWLDAHADFHTPDTSLSGFFDGMGLAMLTGAGWAAARATVEGLTPVAEDRVVLVGARSIDAGEDDRLSRSSVQLVRRPPVAQALADLASRVRGVYLHVDLDVLDPSEGQANPWSEPGGLAAGALLEVVDEVARRFTIEALALTAYDPNCDPDGRIPPVAATVVEHVAAAVERAESVAR